MLWSFNEGYHGAAPESAVRVELCREAMRLAAIRSSPIVALNRAIAVAQRDCTRAGWLPHPSRVLRRAGCDTLCFTCCNNHTVMALDC
jgi:predicted RNA polymerase sigma factor